MDIVGRDRTALQCNELNFNCYCVWQMSMRMGIVFNPEGLELFIMKKVFVVYSWLKKHNVPKPRLKAMDMARMLGFGIEDQLFDFVDKHPLEPS